MQMGSADVEQTFESLESLMSGWVKILLKPYMWRCLSWRALCLWMVITAVIFNEYLVYLIQSWRWPHFPISANDRERKAQVVMLLVGDPQLEGYWDEAPFPIGCLSRWDADRFLFRNFHLAVGYVKPDVIVFLGDLLDEGSQASEREFRDYYERFHSIFTTDSNTETVYIPGDNDVGGEGGDFRTKDKVSRFVDHFQDLTGVTKVKSVDLIKMDIRSQQGLTNEKRKEAMTLTSKLSSPFRILVNHETVLPKLKNHIYPLLKLLHPNLIISAHWHKSNHFVCDDCMSHKSDVVREYWPVYRRDITELSPLLEINLHDDQAINELMMPSCSYRMGETNIGYGVIVISDKGQLHHGILWLPGRYTLLYLYLIILSVLTVGSFFRHCICRLKQSR